MLWRIISQTVNYYYYSFSPFFFIRLFFFGWSSVYMLRFLSKFLPLYCRVADWMPFSLGYSLVIKANSRGKKHSDACASIEVIYGRGAFSKFPIEDLIFWSYMWWFSQACRSESMVALLKSGLDPCQAVLSPRGLRTAQKKRYGSSYTAKKRVPFGEKKRGLHGPLSWMIL